MTEYDIVTHAAMLADTGRTRAYARAIERRVTPGAVVLDVGAGTGVFALLACRAGAARVYALEPDDVIEVARETARANGLADRITFVQAPSTSVELPERVDGIVADLRGALPLFRGAATAIIDARARFLKPGGWIIPARDTLFAAIARSPAIDELLFGEWPRAFGLDLSPVAARARMMWLKHRARAEDLLTGPRPWATLDYETLASPNASGDADWTMTRAGTGHGLLVWFDAEAAPGVTLSNSPAWDEQHIYGQVFFPWPEPVELTVGDRVSVRFRADFVQADYLWTWNTAIERDAGPREYSQSSLSGTSMSAARLRRRAHTFVPSLGEGARADCRMLALMEQGLPLGEIAAVVMVEFPRTHPDYTAALTHAADLSERYST